MELAESRGVALTVFHNRRWDSDQLTLRRLMRRARWVRSSLRVALRALAPAAPWRRLARDTPPARRAAGCCSTSAPTWSIRRLPFSGRSADVYGESRPPPRRPGDDDAFVALEHDSGVRSHLWASSVARGSAGPRLRVLGQRRPPSSLTTSTARRMRFDAGLRPERLSDWGSRARGALGTNRAR